YLMAALALRYNQWVPASGSNSAVECDLAKVEVAGSNPVSRSITFSPSRLARVLFFIGWRGTQVVRERSAKPLCVGSIPTRASNLSSRQFSSQMMQQFRQSFVKH